MVAVSTPPLRFVAPVIYAPFAVVTPPIMPLPLMVADDGPLPIVVPLKVPLLITRPTTFPKFTWPRLATVTPLTVPELLEMLPASQPPVIVPLFVSV